MKKESAFTREFRDVQQYDDYSITISRDAYSKEEAYQKFYEYIEDYDRYDMKSFMIEDIEEDRVIFRGGQNEDGEFLNGWWLNAIGKRSKPVWIYEMNKLTEYKENHYI